MGNWLFERIRNEFNYRVKGQWPFREYITVGDYRSFPKAVLSKMIDEAIDIADHHRDSYLEAVEDFNHPCLESSDFNAADKAFNGMVNAHITEQDTPKAYVIMLEYYGWLRRPEPQFTAAPKP